MTEIVGLFDNQFICTIKIEKFAVGLYKPQTFLPPPFTSMKYNNLSVKKKQNWRHRQQS